MIVGGGRAGVILHAIWRPLALLTGFDVLVTAAYLALGLHWLVPGDVPLPLLGTGLVVFLGMRNNAAYARWWEARTLWGAVVNQSRNLARTAIAVLGHDGSVRDKIIVHQIAWAAALRLALRGEDVRAGLTAVLSPDEIAELDGVTNIPFAVQREIGHALRNEMERGRLDSMTFLSINTVLNALTDAQGGLERIRNTPLPQHYALLPNVFVLGYCLLLPFGVVGELAWATPLGCLLINAVFLTLDRAGGNLENPFARSVYELPMSAISRTIEIDLRDTIGHEKPSPLRAVLGVLR